MILVDTSIWIDHLRRGSARLSQLLIEGTVLCHPAVIGEVALDRLTNRDEVLGLMRSLPKAVVATDDEVLGFIEHHQLSGLGIGYVEAHLLASSLLTDGASLWTADRRLSEAARRLGTGHASPG